MTADELLKALSRAQTVDEADRTVSSFEDSTGEEILWVPVGGRPNNRGTIEVAANTGRSAVERVTNGIDAVLEYQHEVHMGKPECRSPREAARAWLNVPEDGLADLTPRQRQKLADSVVLRLEEGEGPNRRVMQVVDHGTGLSPEEMPSTILSLNESNKIQKHYLAGTYGQGGSATFAASQYSLIASRKGDSDVVAFTVVKYQDLPPEEYKTGRYVYLTIGGQLIQAIGHQELLSRGTMCRHIGYDLTKFISPVGPGSVYGLLNQVLFDPVIPVWLDNRIHDYRRVIKGSRNALNGAVDEGDDVKRGPKLSHSMNIFFVEIGDFGRIGIEYWVLADEKKRPTAPYINPRKPIILTLNGQNQAEMTQALIRKDAELPYLAKRIIVHVDCNSLTPTALRALFISSREDARAGLVMDLIQKELIQALRTDDDLVRLNKEAREHSLRERDEQAVQETRKEVARILKVQGYDLDVGTGAAAGAGDEIRPVRPRPPRPKPPPIELRDPPTFIRLVGPDDKPIKFWTEHRRYVRIETDALSHYHNAKDPSASKINIILGGEYLTLAGTTPLEGGRLRAIVDCARDVTIGTRGNITVELVRAGLPMLSDVRAVEIVRAPEAREKPQKRPLPRFELYPVDGPSDPLWEERDWPDNVNAVASSAIKNEGQLDIYYSTVFPKYVTQLRRFEVKDPALASSFSKRYGIWLAVHSLILDEELHAPGAGEGARESEGSDIEDWERKERCRVATISAMFAAKEVLLPAETSSD